MKRFVLIALLVVAVLVVGTGLTAAQDGHIVERIRDRGELICGVNSVLPGFGTQNDAGDFEGFDVDICRAVAAAILGDSNAIAFRPLAAAERPTALASGEIDMLSRNTTWTLSRDTEWGATFGPTTFYDGQGIMVKIDFGVSTIEELGEESITMCATAGTTTELNITDKANAPWRRLGIEYIPGFRRHYGCLRSGRPAMPSPAISAAWSRAKPPRLIPPRTRFCPAPSARSRSARLARRTTPTSRISSAGVVWGLLSAEEFGIDSMNIGDFMDSEDAGIGRLLGLGDNVAGDYLGINDEFMVDVISQMGNYAEIFNRNLGPDTIFGLERGFNALWTDGGLMYAAPFR